MKKWDIIIIVSLLVSSLVPSFLYHRKQESGILYAEVSVEGKLYETIHLTGQKTLKKWRIETDLGYNEIAVKDEAIGVIEADCKDGLCKDFGFIKKPGEIIVCLPHKLYIQVKGKQDEVDGRTY